MISKTHDLSLPTFWFLSTCGWHAKWFCTWSANMFSWEGAADWGTQRALNTWETSNTLRTKRPARKCAAHRIFNNHWHFSAFFCWTPWQDCLGTDGILASSTVVSAGQQLVLWLLTFYLPWIPNTKLTGQWQLIKLGSLILGFKVMPQHMDQSIL